jgi:hypothetical protein
MLLFRFLSKAGCAWPGGTELHITVLALLQPRSNIVDCFRYHGGLEIKAWLPHKGKAVY